MVSLSPVQDKHKETTLLLLCTLFLQVLLSPRTPKHFSERLHVVSVLRVVTADGMTCSGRDGHPCGTWKQSSHRLQSCCSDWRITSAGMSWCVGMWAPR